MKNPFKQTARATLEAAEKHSEKMIAELDAATEHLVNATVARTEASGQPDDILDALDAKYERAKKLHQRAQERLQLAGQELNRAQAAFDAEQAAERQKKAAALRNKVGATIVARYADSARSTLELIREIARTDAQLADLESRQDGNLVSVEHAARFPRAAREQIVSRRPAPFWTDKNGTILEPQPRESEIKHDRDGAFIMRETGYSVAHFYVERRAFHCIEFRPAILDRGWLIPLAKQLHLPAITDGSPALWPTLEGVPDEPGELAAVADAALKRLGDQLAALKAGRDDRPVKTRLEPVAADEQAADDEPDPESDND